MSETSKLKELLRKTRIAKGGYLTKREMAEVVDGFLAMQRLGVLNKPIWEANRKEVFRRK